MIEILDETSRIVFLKIDDNFWKESENGVILTTHELLEQIVRAIFDGKKIIVNGKEYY